MRSLMEKLSSPVLYLSGAYRRRWLRPENRHTAIALMYHRIAAAGGRDEPAGFGVERGVPVDEDALKENLPAIDSQLATVDGVLAGSPYSRRGGSKPR